MLELPYGNHEGNAKELRFYYEKGFSRKCVSRTGSGVVGSNGSDLVCDVLMEYNTVKVTVWSS